MALPLQPIVSLQPMPLLKRIPVEVIPVEHTARRVEGALLEGALLTVGSSMSLGRVRRPMTSSGPPLQTSHGDGMALPAPIDAATCASRIPIPCAVMGTKRRAHPPKNERRSPLTLSPAPMRGFSFAGRSARHQSAIEGPHHADTVAYVKCTVFGPLALSLSPAVERGFFFGGMILCRSARHQAVP